MIYLIPGFIVLLFAIVFILFFYRSVAELDKNKADQRQLQELSERLETLLENQEQLDRRLSNIEHIVMDDRFTDIAPKESINIKKEMDELKIMIQQLGKK